MIKKILSPIIYGFFMIMVTVSTFIIAVNFVNLDQVNLARFLVEFVTFIIGIPIYYFGNRLLNTLEESKKFSLFDHFRQCVVLYLVTLFSGLFIFLRLMARGVNLFGKSSIFWRCYGRIDGDAIHQ